MKIITVPHPSLRKRAQTVTAQQKKLSTFVDQLIETLHKQDNPKGVGLAAPQVDQNWRIFTTLLPPSGAGEDDPAVPRVFINPTIVDNSPKVTFGPDKNAPILEGCLSIPQIYGPVPRWEWVDVQFQEVVNGEFVTKTERFEAFAGRVMQHEFDHLQGVLFTDYSLEYDLPIYKDRSNKLEELDKRILEAF